MEKFKKTIMIVFAVAILMMPAMTNAGSLEPPQGAPAPTMKTLDQIPPTWDLVIPGSQRFVSGSGNSYMDRETGLTWIAQFFMGSGSWQSAQSSCHNLVYNVGTDVIGGRAGWHLPTVEELLTLYEPYPLNPPPYLPDGHPFNTVQAGPNDCYWTSTTSVYDSDDGVAITFSVDYPFYLILPKSSTCSVVCVRGGR